MATKYQRVLICVTAAVTGFLRRARDVFERKAKAMDDKWDQDLGLALDDEKQNEILIAEEEASWERVADRNDVRADISREQLRPRLAKRYAKREAIAKRIAAGRERVRIVNELRPLHAEKLSALKQRYSKFIATADVPADADFRDFAVDCHELNILTAVLFEATGLLEYRRPFDGVRALKSHWFDVNKARERLLLLVGPGSKPKVGPAEWLAQAHQLTALGAGTTTPQEIVHAR